MERRINITKEKNENPTVNVTVRKSRLKEYSEFNQYPTIYLSDKQEFEIEIFNPTKTTVLAKIYLNNENITNNNGIVLRPGERIFLDRYISKNNKFKFETYDVDGSIESLEAISENGNIRVIFFKEETIKQFFGNNTVLTPYRGENPPPYWGGVNYNTSFGTTGMSSLSNNLTNVSNTSNNNTVKTGIISQGSASSQTFVSVHNSFQTNQFHSVNLKIKPIDSMILESGDLKVKKYCTNCGAKMGPTDKFCSQCGTCNLN